MYSSEIIKWFELLNRIGFLKLFPGADLELRHSYIEESVFYHTRKWHDDFSLL